MTEFDSGRSCHDPVVIATSSCVVFFHRPTDTSVKARNSSRLRRLSRAHGAKDSRHPPQIRSICVLDHKEKFLATGGDRGKIRLWKYCQDVEKTEKSSVILENKKPAKGGVHSLCSSDNLLVSGRDKTISVWKITKGATKAGGHDSARLGADTYVTGLCFVSPNIFASGNSQGKVRTWDLTKKKSRSSTKQHKKSRIHNVRYWKEKNLLLSAGDDGFVCGHDIRQNKFRKTIYRLKNPNRWYDKPDGNPKQLGGLEISESLNLVLGGGVGGELFGFDLRKYSSSKDSSAVVWNKKVGMSWASKIRKIDDHTLAFGCSKWRGPHSLAIYKIDASVEPKMVNDVTDVYVRNLTVMFCGQENKRMKEMNLKDVKERIEFLYDKYLKEKMVTSDSIPGQMVHVVSLCLENKNVKLFKILYFTTF